MVAMTLSLLIRVAPVSNGHCVALVVVDESGDGRVGGEGYVAAVIVVVVIVVAVDDVSGDVKGDVVKVVLNIDAVGMVIQVL